MSKDINGVELKEGQFVVSNPPYYKGLKHGFITKVTPLGATVMNTVYYVDRDKAWYSSQYNRPGSWICVVGEVTA